MNINRIKLGTVVLFNVLGLMWATGLATADHMWARKAGAWLDVPATTAQVDVIVVLGGSSARLPMGGSLYQAGVAPELWYTGARAEVLADPDEHAALVRRTAERAGVPVDAITLLSTTNTWEDGQQIGATVQTRETRSILVVTSWYHGRRALCAIHHHLHDDAIRIYYQSVDTPGFGPDDWWLFESRKRIVSRELYKILFYWGYYGLNPWVC